MVGIIEAAKYAYVYGWINSLPHTLGKEEYERLVEARSIEEVVVTLEHTPYGKRIQEAVKGGINITEIEKSVTQYYVDVCRQIMKALPSGVESSVRSVLLDEWDVYNIKQILRGIYSKKDPEYIMSSIAAAGNISEQELKELAGCDMSTVIRKLQKYNYVFEEGDLFKMETSLDKELIRRWAAEGEKISKLKRVIGMQIDILNLNTLLRFKVLKLDPTSFIKDGFGSHLRFNQLKEIADSNIDAVPDILERTPYKRFKEAFEDFKKTRSLEKLEVQTEKELASYVMHEEPLTLAFVVGYLRRMKIDTRNIRMIMVCKANNIPAEEIRGMLV